MNIYDFNVKKADGSQLALSEYKGKVLLIVNTASNCGYTKQLLGLERTYKEYADKGLEILAFPCNQFKEQEPDPIAEVVANYHEKYGVTFPILNKIDVNGANEDPLFTYLKAQKGFDSNSDTPPVMIPHYEQIDKNYKENSDIKWNFTKFLIDREGNVVKRFEPEQTPSTLVPDIEAVL